MKKFSATVVGAFLVVALLGSAPLARAEENEVNFDFFYAALQDGGSWMESAEYGYVWQPKVAAEKAEWRPYADGYWSQTDQGWTWVSHEDFGWATYHYGRWAKLSEAGWVWVPGYEWAPAWVAWRSAPKYSGRSGPPRSSGGQTLAIESDEVIGWAPLPPDAAFNDSAGFSPQVDVVYDIGPASYNFVPVRYFGEVALLPWIFRPSYNFGFIGSTWNCTNIVYRRGGGYIWCGGPNYAALRPVLQRPIPQLILVAQPLGAARRGGSANRVQGDHFFVTAPRVLPPAGVAASSVGLPINRVTIKPPVTGPAIAAKPIDRGWAGALMDAATTTALRGQLKQQAAAAPKTATAPVSLPRTTNVISVAKPRATPRQTTRTSARQGSSRPNAQARTKTKPGAQPATKPATKPAAKNRAKPLPT